MKKYLVLSMILSMFVLSSQAQVMTVCTPEQLQATANQKLAASVQVTNTATQQLQTYYQQLATYYQQLDKDNQQKAKDAQQIAKDIQQIGKDQELASREAAVAAKEAACAQPSPEINPWKDDGHGGWYKDQCGERWTCNTAGAMFIDDIPLEECLKIKGECAYVSEENYMAYKKEYKDKHLNHSGGADGTNPGGGGNYNGYLNPNNSNP